MEAEDSSRFVDPTQIAGKKPSPCGPPGYMTGLTVSDSGMTTVVSEPFQELLQFAAGFAPRGWTLICSSTVSQWTHHIQESLTFEDSEETGYRETVSGGLCEV